VNPFLRQPGAYHKTPIRAEQPSPRIADGVAVLRLYDRLDSWGGDWGVSAKEFVAALDELPADTTEIRLLINSPGGAVWEGLAILNALRTHRARVVAVVEGIAASAASFIAAGMDELVMARNSELFVHDAWGICIGNSADMVKMAADLAHESDNIASVYAEKAGGTVQQWRIAMAAETWYSAQGAVDAGLADRVDNIKADDGAKARFDLSVFNVAGRRQSPTAPAPVSASGPTSTAQEESMPVITDEHAAALRTRLGLTDADADGDTILAALDEVLAEHTENATPTLPEGTVPVDVVQLEELRVAARAGLEAREQQHREERERTVAAAVADGRIPPARRDHWLNQLEVDQGAAAVLTSLEPGLVPVGEPRGYTGGPEFTADDAAYASLFGKDA